MTPGQIQAAILVALVCVAILVAVVVALNLFGPPNLGAPTR